jgi:hypothetical protein
MFFKEKKPFSSVIVVLLLSFRNIETNAAGLSSEVLTCPLITPDGISISVTEEEIVFNPFCADTSRLKTSNVAINKFFTSLYFVQREDVATVWSYAIRKSRLRNQEIKRIHWHTAFYA